MPGVVTLKDLMDGVRDTLAAWPLPSTLSGALTSSDTTVNLLSGVSVEFTGQKALLEIDDEIMLVTDVVSSTQYTVVRGYQGSTASAHDDASSVNIHPSWSWTNRAIRYDYIQKAIRWLRPDAWVIGVSESFTWPSGSYTAQLPTSSLSSYPHGNQIIKMEYDNGDGDFLPFYGWQQEGPYLRFKERASSNRTIHAVLAVLQPQLQNLTTPLDNDDFEEAIVAYASQLALNSLKTNRVRFAEYAAALNDRTSTPDELIRVAFDLKNQAILAREAASRPMPPNFVKTYRDPG